MADALRGLMDAAEYKHVVLELIFLKYISDAFEERPEAEDARLGAAVRGDELPTELRRREDRLAASAQRKSLKWSVSAGGMRSDSERARAEWSSILWSQVFHFGNTRVRHLRSFARRACPPSGPSVFALRHLRSTSP